MGETTAAMPSKAELLQAEAEAELYSHTFGYLKSMALQSAVKLGIPNVLHSRGGAATVPELLSALPIHPTKRHHLSRLMKMLAAAGIFTAEEAPAAPGGGDGDTDAASAAVYHLNAVSRLLVDHADVDRSPCMSPSVLLATSNLFVSASLQLHRWLLSEEAPTAESPFMAAHGGTLFDVGSRDAELNAVFNSSMGPSSDFVASLVVRECSEVFAGIRSLVDIGGGKGTTARTIAEAFPHIKCSVLDLPQVVQGIPPNGKVEFVAGDMREFVPPADAILFKYVLHNWSDEDCVKILTRCREAVSGGAKAGKVIIIDTVVGSQPSSSSRKIVESQATMDLSMMMLFNGRERDEHNWQKMFTEAGFSGYKLHNVVGMRYLIEVHP